jgi:gliding motility-associated-like protein
MMRIALLLAFLLQFSISYSQVSVTVAEVTGGSGGTVDVDFRVTGFTNISGFQFAVLFDNSVVTVNDVLNLNNGLPAFTKGGSFSLTPNTIRVSWNEDAGSTIPPNSLFFTVRFNVIGAVGSSTEVYIGDGVNLPLEFYDVNFEEVDLNQDRGSVTVIDGGSGNVKLIASNEAASTGSIACVKISAEGFTGIAAMQFSINWDPAFMAFNSIGPTNNNINIGAGNLSINNANGTLGVSHNSVPSLTFPNGTILFEVCFVVTATSGTSSVTFTNNPIVIEFADENGIPIPATSLSGSVTIGGEAPDCEPDGFTLAIQHLTVQPEELFCVDVLVYDFVNVAGMQMTYRWNPAELKFLEVQPVANIGISAGNNFGTSKAVSEGILTFVWNSPIGGDTLNDWDVLFRICFEAIGPVGTEAMININSTEIPVEVQLGDGTFTDLFECKGVVTISDELPFSISLAGSNPSCSNSTNGAISSTVTGGTGNLTYAWSPSTATGANPTGLAPGTYSVTVTDSSSPAKTATAVITLTAVNTITVTPTIVPANCGASTGSITLTIGGNPGNVAYSWSNGLPATNSRLNVPAGTYTVTITYGSGCSFTQAYTVPGTPAISVQGSVNNGTASITLNVTGGSGTYTYLWSPGNYTTKDITGVPPGSYVPTVTDSNGCTGTGGPFVVGGDLDVDIIISDNGGFGVSCNGVCDGEVVAIPVSGTGPFTFKWSNNSTADSLTNVCAGMFTVTVTDANGMTSSATANVTSPARLTITIESFTKSSGSDGAATVEATGGVPGYTYTWNDPAETQGASISGLPPERFIVTATDANGCTATRPINFAEESECYEAIPAITPNGDGYNDALVISCLEGTTNRIEIFDRWARPVFSARNYANDWQGTSQGGETLPDGGYFVVIRATESTGIERVERRSFSIIRTLR